MCKEGKCGCSGKMVLKVLLIIGGLNWGFYGVTMFLGTDINVIHMLIGKVLWLEAIIYIIVGLAAVVEFFGCPCKKCKECCKVDAPTETTKTM